MNSRKQDMQRQACVRVPLPNLCDHITDHRETNTKGRVVNEKSSEAKEAPEKPKGNRTWKTVGAIVAAIALVVSGTAGWMAYQHERETASSACRHDASALRKTMKTYAGLLKGEAHAMATLDPSTVADPHTITVLAKKLNEKQPKTVSCDADGISAMKAADTSARDAGDWYRLHLTGLRKATKAVKDSRTDKTIEQAKQMLKDSEGKVQDEAVRDRLAKAIESRNDAQIVQAMNDVNADIQARQAADAQAQANTAVQQSAAKRGTEGSTGETSGDRTPAYRRPNGNILRPGTPSHPSPSQPSPGSQAPPSSAGQKPGWDGTVNFDGTDDTSGAWHNISIPTE
ncbi:hypothetical protein PT279_07735 [Bifidobacterium sp. ESL0784]|uniref:hypothetical protein n=1 Tax=Bifidobacterium sp. ESL0784 TaxID=2983231 RepID=UPI0023F9A2A1|nr:hypothetical protein [Bifidobacterium sp. ESL0784]MDF7641473.1 hypothetical protein [Bifidobacterium sp. ESL0784]